MQWFDKWLVLLGGELRININFHKRFDSSFSKGKKKEGGGEGGEGGRETAVFRQYILLTRMSFETKPLLI